MWEIKTYCEPSWNQVTSIARKRYYSGIHFLNTKLTNEIKLHIVMTFILMNGVLNSSTDQSSAYVYIGLTLT